MRRAAARAALVLWVGLAMGSAAQEAPAGSEQGGSLVIWKWANFLLLAGGLGYLIRKHGGPYFAMRSREIRRHLVEAEEARQDAKRRVDAMEARLASLDAEIEALKREALAEQGAESAQFGRQGAAELAKIQARAAEEIEAAGKQARLELKRHTAVLAIALARDIVRARMTPEAQSALLAAFARNLESPEARARTT